MTNMQLLQVLAETFEKEGIAVRRLAAGHILEYNIIISNFNILCE